MIAGLQVTLGVADVVRSVRFYRDVLGFEFRGYWDPVAGATVPEWRMEVQPDYAEVFAGSVRIGFRPVEGEISRTGSDLTLFVPDLFEAHRRLRDEASELTEPERQPWGARMFFFRDPDGHRWGVLGG